MSQNHKFSKKLISWYAFHKRDLPWRHTQDPYRIWLSEIILQQTQVAQGLPYYNKFITQYPTVFDLANASQDDVLKSWQGLGYYSRARNLHETAQYIAHSKEGNFPTTYKELLKLKGVGDYTASAIASICYKEPVAVVDGNVYRVLSRYFGINTPINSSKGQKEFKALAESLLDKKDPDTFNQAIMEFGATHCKPKNPLCSTCPFNDSCIALRDQKTSTLPVKIKKNKVKKRYFNYIVPFSLQHQTQLIQRKGRGIWRGLYEFPIIESDSELKNISANILSKHEITSLDNIISISNFNTTPIVHKLSHQHLYTKFWIVKVKSLTVNSIDINNLDSLPVPVLIENFIEAYQFSDI